MDIDSDPQPGCSYWVPEKNKVIKKRKRKQEKIPVSSKKARKHPRKRKATNDFSKVPRKR